MRDEFADASGVGIRLDEESLPVRDAVRGVCEILGLDALYLANEGKLAAVVPAEAAGRTLAAMRAHPGGADSRIIGEVIPPPRPPVTPRTALGRQPGGALLVRDPLPRLRWKPPANRPTTPRRL